MYPKTFTQTRLKVTLRVAETISLTDTQEVSPETLPEEVSKEDTEPTTVA
jgi:hypothetical protein